MNPQLQNLYSKNVLSKDDSFRLISLQPGPSHTPLALCLLNTNLSDIQPYDAVSYVWGDMKDPISISVQDADGSQTHVRISRNCHAALSSLRDPHASRLLWIDSICIDQESTAEKNHQIGLMGLIYQNASKVMVYLGKGTSESDTAMRCLRELDEPSNDNSLAAVGASAVLQENRVAVDNLFKRPWFFRVWVLQEITFAQTATVICGDYQLDWESFKTFYHWNVNAGWIEKLPFSINYAVSPSPFVSYVTYGERLLKILVDTRSCGATDPRDKLYAIIPLLDRDHEGMQEENEEQKERWQYNEEELRQLSIRQRRLNIQVNYSDSVSRVYTELATLLMGSIGLDVLSYVVKESAMPGLPTWVPDWTVLSPYWSATQKVTRGRYKPFSGFPKGPSQHIWGWRMLYPHLIDTWTISNYPTASGESSKQLHIQAVSLGRIEKLGDVCDLANNYFPTGQWASLVPDESYLKNPEMPRGLPTEEAHEWDSGPRSLSLFARTLTFDTVVYPQVAKDAITYIRRYNGEIVDDADSPWGYFGDPNSSNGERMPLIEIFQGPGSFERQVMQILKRCDGKRLCILDTGRIALLHDKAQVGDEVFVVEGASTPFVFREATKDIKETTLSERILNLVGDGFVLGVMNGEIWDLVDNGEACREKLTIR
ncbi:hypothetical protein SNK05_002114 [Fusarium graminearum]|nr:hypothetical protein FG05_12017 [Fusarium graminearum]CAF3630277.1 unnamed protein product [Fusarium graminearum]